MSVELVQGARPQTAIETNPGDGAGAGRIHSGPTFASLLEATQQAAARTPEGALTTPFAGDGSSFFEALWGQQAAGAKNGAAVSVENGQNVAQSLAKANGGSVATSPAGLATNPVALSTATFVSIFGT